MSGSLVLVLFPFLSGRPVYVEKKNGLVRHTNVMTPEVKEIVHPTFHLVFNQGSHENKKARRAPTLVKQSPPHHEMS